MTSNSGGRWALIVHGGAKEIAPAEEQANRDGILAAIEAGRAVLEQGGSAVDAVEACIRTLEDLPVFNAGRGSEPNDRGEVEMCAGLMDGRDLAVGAVGAIREVRNPISVARRLMAEKEIILVGEGALKFAEEQGAERASNAELRADAEKEKLEEAHDTVGAVALDTGGNLAAGTSTGGLTGQKKGRIGDSPLPGSGLYADNHVGAVAFSGDGESIARLALSAQVMARIGRDGPESAIGKAVGQLLQMGGDGGGIGIAKDGRVGWAHNSPHFAVAMATSDMDRPGAWLKKDEEKSG